MSFETELLILIAEFRTPLLTEFMNPITILGSFSFALVFLTGIFLSNRDLGKTGFIAFALNSLVVYSLKLGIDRARPETVQMLTSATTPSFPSGHASTVFVLATILSYKKEDMKYFFFSLAFLVAFSRIYLGVHYISDVLVGALIGYLVSKLVLNNQEKFASWL